MSRLKDKTVLLGVTGGIAAYKAAEIVRLLVQRDVKVRVMMTPNAREFITPLTLQTLSQSSRHRDVLAHRRIADRPYPPCRLG